MEHDRESYCSFLKGLPPACRIAVESVGNWYCLIDEMERARHVSALAHPAKAKLIIGRGVYTVHIDSP